MKPKQILSEIKTVVFIGLFILFSYYLIQTEDIRTLTKDKLKLEI